MKYRDMINLKIEFERWVKLERKQSVEKYETFPFSYKLSEVGAMWEAWQGAWECKEIV